MNISDQAENYILQAMKENHVSTLRFYGVAGCCGVNLGVTLQAAEENDFVEQINGVQVAIHPDVKNQLEGVTVDVEEENGEIGIVLKGYDNHSCC